MRSERVAEPDDILTEILEPSRKRGDGISN